MIRDAMPNAFRPGDARLSERERLLVGRRQAVLGPAYRLFYERPLHIVRGEGVWLYDAEGTAYLDAYNNVASLGHCHPRVVEAVARQAAELATHTRYLHDGVLELAERLLATLPEAIGHVMFTCTGSEANDLALRLAFAATGGTGVIVTENAYHGVTLAVAALSPSLGPGVPLGAHVRTVPAPDAARQADAGFAAAVAAAAADLQRHGIRPAALIVDTVFSSDGVFTDPPDFLAPAAEAIRAAGGLFIADEVQPGFGRTGEAMWGFLRHGVVPDMISMGKPMGNGYPVAALALRPELVEGFGARARYFNTFGGNAVAAAAALAVLEVIEAERVQANALTVGARLREDLRALAARFPRLGAVRGAGLFIGIDVEHPDSRAPDPVAAGRIVNGLREARVLISATGPLGHVLKIRPPLVFSEAHAALFLERIESVLVATG
ncbi:aspartate aminotransferase family protein [Cereibacter azotoformans]|uniref:4-aminobutyrate aminotransferase-like enzyme n=1 Tax=Cereibacter azotoformans TaxID=43057 RepID=A0A2T5K0C6_9RHOB|nr:aspartate aminotransferase family protein [Cereibacter azotoformans]AXQ93089.1 aspartate aminotransferase family protein [Cereibacter sphaeroides]MBO4169213.1 aspartate aminotransferase family protein [Cereibacter azotoformans]PTR15893.1 4-aminobutyrate aminotransferase-like enzyme [Cereibacter azotoformans]UIJ31396.1 aspartate aminotransferase family protein [Cereibacter azotoformans]